MRLILLIGSALILLSCSDILVPDFERRDLISERVVLRHIFYRDYEQASRRDVSSLVADRFTYVERRDPKNANRVIQVNPGTDSLRQSINALGLQVGDTVQISTRCRTVGEMYLNRKSIPGWGSGYTNFGPHHDLMRIETAGR